MNITITVEDLTDKEVDDLTASIIQDLQEADILVTDYRIEPTRHQSDQIRL